MRRRRVALLLAVVGPGLLAGLSDDDPPGITTYSILGAEHGYQLLWVLALSTAALIVFHELGARIGVVTGQGLDGPGPRALRRPRRRRGARRAAGREPRHDVRGVRRRRGGARARRRQPLVIASRSRRWRVSALVLRGGFRRIEHVLLALASVFAAYIVAGLLAHPDWGAAAHGLVVPSLPGDARRRAARRRDRRHDAGAVGARVHPVLRGRQAPRPPTTRATSASTSSAAR